MRSTLSGRRALIAAALGAAVLLTSAPPPPAAAYGPGSQAARVIGIARAQLGDPWRFGAKGPRAFDCSGLVIYAYRQAGLGKLIGNGRYRGARAMYRWFQRRGLASRTNPRPGDLVVWGRGTHIGIYIGGGRAISTLTRGVRIHRVHAVRARFTAYLHTGLAQYVTPPVVAPSPSPTPSPAATVVETPVPSAQPSAAPASGEPTPSPDPSPLPTPSP